MMRLIPASRAMVLATGLVLAATTYAMAEEASATAPAAVEEAKAATPFSPEIYVGPGFGYADADGSQFGWSVSVLMRVLRYGALQIEYLNLGSDPKSSGDSDNVYFGVAPILPINDDLALYGQIGASLGDGGQNVAAGGGLMYDLPIEFLTTNKIDLTLKTDYKYLNIDGGEHLLTFGFMFGFHK